MITPLKLARIRRGWKQSDVADRLGIGAAHLSRMENGTARASAEMVKTIAAVFTELSRDQILFPEEYVVAGLEVVPIQATGVA